MKLKNVFHAVMGVLLAASISAQAADPVINVFKTATCGCCAKWVDHLRANGFVVNVQNVANTGEYRLKYGVPEKLMSCHTAVVNGYAIEGHVPAREIQRLVKSGSKAKGLAVPGMPSGSPGMEGPPPDSYSVVLFDAQGKTSIYQTYPAN